MAADLKALAKRFNDEVFTQGKVEVIDEIVADGYIEHQEFPGLEPSKEGLKQFIKVFHDAFDNINIEMLSVAVDGDELWVHSVFTGTHTGEFAGIPATGKKVTLAMMDRVKTRDGKAIEHWGVSDDLGMMTQLGVIPEMG
jgi:predicted SnoaL-like aldol condensation-catalyzing enzyme